MQEEKPPVGPSERDAVPLWMRRGTLWVIMALTVALGALVAYYLLPGWWASLVRVWVNASNAWVTGILLGFIPVTIGLAALRGALHLAPREDRDGRVHHLRPFLGALAGLCLVTMLLTVFIAMGATEPLREARSMWQESAPGVLAATLVGGLLGVIAVLGFYALRMRLRSAPGQATGEDDVTMP